MRFNPLANRAYLGMFITSVISLLLFFTDNKALGEVLFVFSILWFIGFQIIRVKKRKQKESREKEFKKYVKRTNADFSDFFDQPFKDGLAMQCFSFMENPSFYNVIEKSDDENGKLFIGELEWIDHMELSIKGIKDSNYATRTVTNSKEKQIGNKSYATMCVVYDKGFRLPNFDLTIETLGKRTAEVLKLNKSLDIDFDDDKKFSDAWWLTTNETVPDVKDLFSRPIRLAFMRYVSKGYRIAGQADMIILITKNVHLPDEYSKVIYDMRAIQKTLRTNTKFYTQPKH